MASQPSHYISNFMTLIEDLEGKPQLDIFDQRLVELEPAMTRYFGTHWPDSMKITTLAYQAYGSPTLWWVLMMYNGYTHPLEIPDSAVIKIPPYEEILRYIQRLQPAKQIGTVVVI